MQWTRKLLLSQEEPGVLVMGSAVFLRARDTPLYLVRLGSIPDAYTFLRLFVPTLFYFLMKHCRAGYNSNHDAATLAKGELERKFGVRVITVAGDISVPATLIALFQAVKALF